MHLRSFLASLPLETLNTELTAVKARPSSTVLGASLALLARVGTMDDCTALVCNVTNGAVKGDALTAILAETFPSNRVSGRHGPHYLSHARTGKLNPKGIPLRAKPAGGRSGASGVGGLDLSGLPSEDIRAALAESDGTVATVLRAELVRRGETV